MWGPRLTRLFLLLVCSTVGPPLRGVLASVLDPHGRSVDTVASNYKAGDDVKEYFSLPDGFLFGAGTSAMQVEGAWEEDGREPSALEYVLQFIPPNTTYSDTNIPKVTADSYHRYKEDVAMAAALKLEVYRFSVSWPRLIPSGDPNVVNQPGVDYYNNLINELIKNNIKPMITMNHFDLPLQVFKNTGGWANDAIVPAFTAFADVLFRNFGDRVKLWTTVNEANYYCMTFALFPVPGIYERKPGDDYKCVHNTILAHMEVYRLYQEKYRATQNGQIGAAALTLWCRPNTTSYEDIQAAERANLFALGSIYHPVVHGDYPTALKERVAHYSEQEGRAVSRLPVFSDDQKARLKGSADFLCFNAYMGTTVADGTKAAHPQDGTIQSDRDAVEVGTDTRPGFFGDLFMRANPWVLRDAPLWVRDNYPGIPLFITENGWGDERPGADPLDDWPRVGYHSEYLHQLVRAATEDKVNIMGYLAWSLIDTYEWTANFDRKFGLVHVDFEKGSLNRTLKKSAWFFQEIGANRRVPIVPFTFVPGSGSGNNTPSVSGSETILMSPMLTVFLVSILYWQN